MEERGTWETALIIHITMWGGTAADDVDTLLTAAAAADFYMSSFEINFALLHKLVFQCGGHFISMSISYHILKSGRRRVKEVVSIESWS